MSLRTCKLLAWAVLLPGCFLVPAFAAASWSISAGALPPGLSLNETTGLISGTPSAAGAYSFTITVTDGVKSGSKGYAVTITSDEVEDGLLIMPAALPDGVVGQTYKVQLAYTTVSPTVGFPQDHILRTPMDTAPVLPNSDVIIQSIISAAGKNPTLHPGFEIPVTEVAGAAFVNIIFASADESDPGPYPIPPDVEVEDGSDAHAIVLDTSANKLYEVYQFSAGPPMTGNAGAVFDLSGYALRPLGNTSADAAGLPIEPLLLRFKEFAQGHIDHPIRVTVPRTRNFGNEGLPAGAWSPANWPARHRANTVNTNPADPAMGERFRLKAGFDASGLSAEAQIIIQCLKKYGLIVADQGQAFFIQGDTDPGWLAPTSGNYSTLTDKLETELRNVHATDFEVIDGVTPFLLDPESAQAGQPGAVSQPTIRPRPVAQPRKR